VEDELAHPGLLGGGAGREFRGVEGIEEGVGFLEEGVEEALELDGVFGEAGLGEGEGLSPAAEIATGRTEEGRKEESDGSDEDAAPGNECHGMNLTPLHPERFRSYRYSRFF
jgi:hypothetical protein